MNRRRVVLAGLVLGFGLGPRLAGAQEPAGEPRTEVGFVLGVGVADGSLEGRPTRGLGAAGPVAGIRGALRFGGRWNWYGDATSSRHSTELARGSVEVNAVRTGVEYFFGRSARARWFLAGGAGWAEVDYKAPRDFSRALGSAGFGQRYRLAGEDIYYHWELRIDRLFGSGDGFGEAALSNGQFLFGWSLALGRPPADTDADGVNDRRDRCPGTPQGARVDASGCPLDADGDGVPDGTDLCPDTPRGTRVDSRGCPLDSDADGVPDDADRCPDTPRRANVDARGCPLDADGDTVPDGIDACPDTPLDVMVDLTGCPIDLDGDGVPNGIDQCPGTPPGTKVDAQGCPVP